MIKALQRYGVTQKSDIFPCNNISILVIHTAIITGMGKYET